AAPRYGAGGNGRARRTCRRPPRNRVGARRRHHRARALPDPADFNPLSPALGADTAAIRWPGGQAALGTARRTASRRVQFAPAGVSRSMRRDALPLARPAVQLKHRVVGRTQQQSEPKRSTTYFCAKLETALHRKRRLSAYRDAQCFTPRLRAGPPSTIVTVD